MRDCYIIIHELHTCDSFVDGNDVGEQEIARK
jgi:hypothetical protein